MQIPHLSWGQDLGGDEAGRRRMSAWRESGTVMGALMAVFCALGLGAILTGTL